MYVTMSHYVGTHFPLKCLPSVPSASPHELSLDSHTHCGQCQKKPTLCLCPVSHSLLTPWGDTDWLQDPSPQPCHRLFCFHRIPFPNASTVEFYDLFHQQLHLTLPLVLYSDKRIYCGFQGTARALGRKVQKGQTTQSPLSEQSDWTSLGQKSSKLPTVFYWKSQQNSFQQHSIEYTHSCYEGLCWDPPVHGNTRWKWDMQDFWLLCCRGLCDLA